MFAEKLRLVAERLADIFYALVAFLPALLAAVVVFLVGWLFAHSLRFLVFQLFSFFDRPSNKGAAALGGRRFPHSLVSKEFASHIVYWLVLLLTLVLCLEVLGLPVGIGIVQGLLGTVPRVFVALLILFFGFLIALGVEGFARSFLRRLNWYRPELLAKAFRWVTLAVVTLLAVEQLGLAAQFVLWLLLVLVGGLVLALSLAFGLGCREMARDLVIEFFRKEESGTPESPA